MDWNQLNRSLYFRDGSLRDIYAFEFTSEDWRKWVELVNEQYTVQFHNGTTGTVENRINFDLVLQQWANPDAVPDWSRVHILIRGFTVACHFFMGDDFENDIAPREFQSLDDHTALLAYLKLVSESLRKPVVLTLENSPEHVLMEVNGSEVKYYQ